MNEKNYIRYRKLKAFGNSLCFYLCRIFPIKKNLISVCTFEGKGGFGCNPKYIVQELHRRNPEYEFVWFVNDMSKEFPDYIRKVPNTLWSRAYWLSRSRVWIDNYRKPLGTKKRNGQYYLNTWHGTVGFKSIGLWRENSFSKMAYLVSKEDSKLIDVVVIDSEWCEEIFPKGLLYRGQFLKSGMPRCDVLVGRREECRKKFHKKYGLPLDVKVLMYAPTFRETVINGKRKVINSFGSIDFRRVSRILKSKFGGEWKICIRMHPQLQKSTLILCDNHYIDVTLEDDMYELLAAVDCFITDYSSTAMEAGFMGIPVFLYAEDFDNYCKDRGGRQWVFEKQNRYVAHNNYEMTPGLNLEFPYTVAENNDDLEADIMDFDMKAYEKKMSIFKEQLQLVFDGQASKRVADHLQIFLSKM